jgi:glycosyltransferase involved in cell wall biosynthesis
MDISIIICTFNRSQMLAKVLEDLDKQVVPRGVTWEALVVDNNSTDKTRAVVENFEKEGMAVFRYVFENRQGKSYALNSGIRAARGEIVAFTDDDVQIDPHWLWNLKKVFDEYDCGGVGGRIVPQWTCEKPKWLQADGPNQLMDAIIQFDRGDMCCELKAMPFGANMAFKKSMFQKYGLFRLDLGPRPGCKIYYEDTEFGLRVKSGGEKLMYAPDAIVYHPVEKERVEKGYYQSWYFGFGGAMVRTHRFPQSTVFYCGVPRYFFKQFAKTMMRWVFTFESQKRFFYKLNTYLEAGKIAEAYNISRNRDRP